MCVFSTQAASPLIPQHKVCRPCAAADYLKPELTNDTQPQPDFSDFIAKVKRGQEAVGAQHAVPILLGAEPTLQKDAEPLTVIPPAPPYTLNAGFRPAPAHLWCGFTGTCICTVFAARHCRTTGCKQA